MLDCHIHLERGPYTIAWIQEFINTAVARGMEEIYLLEHSHRFREFLPMYQFVCEYSDYQKDWFARKNAGDQSINEYTKFISEAKQMQLPIKVRFGLEVCYFEDSEELIKDVTSSYPFDFITGSVHWVDGFGFDHSEELWDKRDIDETYQRYYEMMQHLIKSRLFTGLAHPDSIKAFGHKPSYDLTDTYNSLADLLLQTNMYAEQSGGLNLNYSKDCELGMNAQMVHIFKEKGVKILTASDAHCPQDVGANISKLLSLL